MTVDTLRRPDSPVASRKGTLCALWRQGSGASFRVRNVREVHFYGNLLVNKFQKVFILKYNDEVLLPRLKGHKFR